MFVCAITGDLNDCEVGLGAGGAAGCDKLKAELKLVEVVAAGGDDTLGGAGFGGEAGVEPANPPKSSAANKSTGSDVVEGFGAGAGIEAGAVF